MSNKDRQLRVAKGRESRKIIAEKQIERIDTLSKSARTTWFGMLFFLTFVLVALMGVRDVDFFLTDRETPLPVVGVSVPTFLFFAVTPVLGSILYAYFHMHLLKLWEALARTPAQLNGQPLSDQISPWLINDLALAYRKDEALTHRPLRWVSHWINIAIAFWGTPLILAGFWVRSFAPHKDWLTLIACGLPLVFSIYVGAVSWWRMKALLGGNNDVTGRKAIMLLASATFAVSVFGWLRVEGSFKSYLEALGRRPSDSSAWAQTFFPDLLYSADLAEVNFAQTPDGWVNRELFREQFRPQWCQTVGIQPEACGAPPAKKPTRREALFLMSREQNPNVKRSESSQSVSLARNRHCNLMMVVSRKDGDCESLFASLDQQFEKDWLRQRELAEANLHSFYLGDADLKQANLSGAQLQGADLAGAQLQGATLGGAQLQGADLFVAEFDETTDLTAATLRAAAVRSVDFRTVAQIEPHLDTLFGDATVKLPEGMARPDRFNVEYEDWDAFRDAWREFQRSIGQDPENPE